MSPQHQKEEDVEQEDAAQDSKLEKTALDTIVIVSDMKVALCGVIILYRYCSKHRVRMVMRNWPLFSQPGME